MQYNLSKMRLGRRFVTYDKCQLFKNSYCDFELTILINDDVYAFDSRHKLDSRAGSRDKKV